MSFYGKCVCLGQGRRIDVRGISKLIQHCSHGFVESSQGILKIELRDGCLGFVVAATTDLFCITSRGSLSFGLRKYCKVCMVIPGRPDSIRCSNPAGGMWLQRYVDVGAVTSWFRCGKFCHNILCWGRLTVSFFQITRRRCFLNGSPANLALEGGRQCIA